MRQSTPNLSGCSVQDAADAVLDGGEVLGLVMVDRPCGGELLYPGGQPRLLQNGFHGLTDVMLGRLGIEIWGRAGRIGVPIGGERHEGEALAYGSAGAVDDFAKHCDDESGVVAGVGFVDEDGSAGERVLVVVKGEINDGVQQGMTGGQEFGGACRRPWCRRARR